MISIKKTTAKLGGCTACVVGREFRGFEGTLVYAYTHVWSVSFGHSQVFMTVRLCDPCLVELRDACAEKLLGGGK